jgi:hypothetical protein
MPLRSTLPLSVPSHHIPGAPIPRPQQMSQLAFFFEVVAPFESAEIHAERNDLLIWWVGLDCIEQVRKARPGRFWRRSFPLHYTAALLEHEDKLHPRVATLPLRDVARLAAGAEGAVPESPRPKSAAPARPRPAWMRVE